MLPIKKFFGRKSENRKTCNENDEPDVNRTRLSRRHSSGRASVSTEGFHDQPTTKLSMRRSSLFIRSPFKRRNSTSSCHGSQCSVECACSDGRETKTASRRLSVQQHFSSSAATSALTTPVGDGVVPDENGNATENTSGDSDATMMNGNRNHCLPVRDGQLDLAGIRGSPKLSVIERKIWNHRRNSALADIDRRGSLKPDAVDQRNVVQGVPDGAAVDGFGSPRLYVKGPGAATLFSRIDRCAGSIGGLSRPAATAASTQSNGFPGQSPAVSSAAVSPPSLPTTPGRLPNIDPDIVPTTGPENSYSSANGCVDSPSIISITPGDIHHEDSVFEESVRSENPDSTTADISTRSDQSFVGISSQTRRLPTFSSDTSASETSDTPVPPPRRNRGRVRRSCASDLPRGRTAHRAQPLSRTNKSRSLSELSWPNSDVFGSPDGVRSSAVTSGILSDVSLPSVTSSFSASSSSSPLTLNSEQYSSSLSSPSALSPSLVVTAASVATSNYGPTSATIAPSSPPPSSSSSTLSAHRLNSDQFDHVSSRENPPSPSRLSPPSDQAEESFESRRFGDCRQSPISAADPERSGKPLYARPPTSLPLTSLRGLRYSSNYWIADRVRSGSEPEAASSPALVRMTGLTLDHVMTPPRITMTTEKSVAVAERRSSPDADITNAAEISQLDDRCSHHAADKNHSALDHEIHNERLVVT